MWNISNMKTYRHTSRRRYKRTWFLKVSQVNKLKFDQIRHHIQDFIHRTKSENATRPKFPILFQLDLFVRWAYFPHHSHQKANIFWILLPHKLCFINADIPFVVIFCEWTEHSVIFNDCCIPLSILLWDQTIVLINNLLVHPGESATHLYFCFSWPLSALAPIQHCWNYFCLVSKSSDPFSSLPKSR